MTSIFIPRFLRQLRDVQLTSPADSEVLTYEASSSKFKNKPVSGSAAIVSTTFASAYTAGGGTISVKDTPSWWQNGQFVVVEPYTSNCEITRTAAVTGSSSTILPMAKNHSAGAIVMPTQGLTNARWFGAQTNQSGGQEVPISAACAEVERVWGQGKVYLPAGTYRCSGEIVVPGGVGIIGDPAHYGSGVSYTTRLEWNSDLGSGKYAIRPSDINDSANHFENLGLVGPHAYTGPSDTPAVMNGLRIGSSTTVSYCSIGNFYGSIASSGNHYTIDHCVLGTSKYGVYLEPSGAGGIGNCILDSIQCLYCYGVVAVSGPAYMDASIFKDIGTDHCTFVFYKELHTGSTAFIVNSYLIRFGGEAHGNGLYYDENVGVHPSTFGIHTDIIPSGLSYAATFYDSGKPIQMGKVANGTAASHAYSWQIPDGAPCFWQSNSGTLVLEDSALALFTRLNSGGVPITPNGSDNFCISSYWRDDQGAQGVFKKLKAGGSAVAIGQLTVRSGRNDIDVYPTGSTPVPAGFALMAAASAGDVIPVHTRGGEVPAVPCTGTVTTGDWLKPSTSTAGKVMTATGPSDGPIVGQAMSGGTNTNIIVEPRI